MLSLSDNQKIGIGLTGFGCIFLFLGCILFFDRVLLAFGNILFVSGLGFIIGLNRTFNFFFQPHKLKGSSLFFAGILLIIFGWTFTGMLVESYWFWVNLGLCGQWLSTGAAPISKSAKNYNSTHPSPSWLLRPIQRILSSHDLI